MEALLSDLGEEITDIDEETFLLFAQDIPSSNLGFIDSKASSVDITVAGRDFVIVQSPGLLSSNRSAGTTGAVAWKITSKVAEWLTTPTNILFRAGILSANAAVLELGCGINPIIGLALHPYIRRYTLTDQSYVAKIVEQNIARNTATTLSVNVKVGSGSGAGASADKYRSKSNHHTNKSNTHQHGTHSPNIRFTTLDWEEDMPTAALTGDETISSFDMVIACDCIYNETLVEPFVDTCLEVCKLRSASVTQDSDQPCICVVAQQLRDPMVFEAWLQYANTKFRLWRVPDEALIRDLGTDSGFVVHIGVLRE